MRPNDPTVELEMEALIETMRAFPPKFRRSRRNFYICNDAPSHTLISVDSNALR